MLLLAVVTSACGEPGSDPYAGLTVYDAPGGAYRLRYLAPPWTFERADTSSVYLRIESTVPDGVDPTVIPDRYELTITLEAGAAQDRARQDASSAPSRGERVLVSPRAVSTDSGDSGFEVLTEEPGFNTRFYRYVSLTRRGGVVRLVFEGTPNLDEVELDEMIYAFDVAP